MSARRALLDRAVAGALAPQFREFRKGQLSVEDLEAAAEKRARLIRDTFRDAAAAPPAPRCHCGSVATTRIAGRDYCDEDAAKAPRRLPGAA